MPSRLPAIAAALLTIAFGALCAAFAAQPTLATFADDSVSYLVMAQVFSPWAAVSAPIAEAYAREGFYPPLFPLVIAVLGAAHDITRAHVATALILAACLPVLYLLARETLASGCAALAAVAVVAVLPASWINAKGILSEPLYCLALLALLWATQAEGRRRIWILALSLVALVLTRTAGLALVAAYAAWALTQRDRVRLLLPAAVAIAAYAAWLLVRPAATADVNVAFLSDYGWRPNFTRQAHSIAEAWIGSLLLYWVEDRPLRTALAGAAGLLSLAGLALRLRAGKADAWIMAAYVATFLLWPFYDQMGRFIFPALPVLVVYALHAAGTLGQRPVIGYAVAAALFVSLAAPTLAFLYERSTSPAPYAEMVDWYRYPDWREAQARAEVHIGLLQDMQALQAHTRGDARVMWVTPGYVPLLAGRRGVAAPDARLAPEQYRQAVLASGADYVLLTAYHPRDTLSDEAWRAGLRALDGRFPAVHARKRGDSLASVLFRLK
jgi:hypothetical protein